MENKIVSDNIKPKPFTLSEFIMSRSILGAMNHETIMKMLYIQKHYDLGLELNGENYEYSEKIFRGSKSKRIKISQVAVDECANPQALRLENLQRESASWDGWQC